MNNEKKVREGQQRMDIDGKGGDGNEWALTGKEARQVCPNGSESYSKAKEERGAFDKRRKYKEENAE